MSRYIIKLTDKKTKKDYYLEWSTIVDAPVTWGMTLKEFKKYYKAQYGRAGLDELPSRLQRVEATGTSSMHKLTAEDCIAGNRAGKKEVHLTYEEIVSYYCIKKVDP